MNKSKITWQCPSNIALVKYWGKKEGQIAANPSISFVLNNCYTTTSIEFEKHSNKSTEIEIDFYYDGKVKESFQERVVTFFQKAEKILPFLTEYKYKIDTTNNFPHSSGIASSASAMGALALCLRSLDEVHNSYENENFFEDASFLARLGSGSACRSVYSGFSLWGEHKLLKNSHDEFAVPINDKIDSIFKTYRDTVLLVHEGTKEISSTMGHSLLKNHPFAELRYKEANDNIVKLLKVLGSGDLDGFVDIVEKEAMMLHALMMTSTPPFILFQPNTIEIIQKVWEYRKNSNSHLCFTLDAGANVHLLYPEYEEKRVVDFIQSELLAYCQNGSYICNQIGEGPKRLLTQC